MSSDSVSEDLATSRQAWRVRAEQPLAGHWRPRRLCGLVAIERRKVVWMLVGGRGGLSLPALRTVASSLASTFDPGRVHSVAPPAEEVLRRCT